MLPPIAANNFEIKPSMVQMIQNSQFHGLPTEDPVVHMTRFVDSCTTLNMDGVSVDLLLLILFLFSFTDRAKKLFMALPP